MHAVVTSSTSARWGHRALRAKSRVVGLNISGRARTGDSAASKARMRWENQRREPDLAADRVKYLQPETWLQIPKRVLEKAYLGQSMPAYAYADNNPISNVDPTGNGTNTYDTCIENAIKNGEDPKAKCNMTADELRKWMECHDKWAACLVKCGPTCDPLSDPVGAAKRPICVFGCELELTACMMKVFK